MYVGFSTGLCSTKGETTNACKMLLENLMKKDRDVVGNMILKLAFEIRL
jgi:hypothetical protein